MSRRGPSSVRERLVSAAADLLVERPAHSITGRDLARRANVNYGLIHHYFGSKTEVLNLALRRLRDEFMERFHQGRDVPFPLDGPEPYLQALAHVRDDYPNASGRLDDVLLSTVAADVRERLDVDDPERDLEARARTLAAASMRIGWSMLQEIMLDALDADPGERDRLVAAITELYDGILLRESQRSGRPT